MALFATKGIMMEDEDLTVDFFWQHAPEWAKFHACDANKKGSWYENEPKMEPTYWMCNGGASFSGYTLKPAADWQKSLLERPT